MEQCSICLEGLENGVTLACGHRFHADCLAQMASAVGTAATRRGALTACPNCRAVSRVALTPVAEFGLGDRVEALWGQRWYPGVVDGVIDGGRAYEIRWDDGDEGDVLAAHVREAPGPARPPPRRPAAAPAVAPVRPAPRRPPIAPAASAAAPEEAPAAPSTAAPTPTPRRLTRCGNCKACRARKGQPCRPSLGAPVPPPATRSHVASTASAWVAACTDLLEASKDRTNMRCLRAPLVSRGFICGADNRDKGLFSVAVPAEFPCYYDVIGKDYVAEETANSLSALRKYLEGALALAQTGGGYRTEDEYRPRAPAPVRAPKTSRFTGVSRDRTLERWRAEIGVRGSSIHLGSFDDEEDAARTYDAALVKYKGLQTVNFPGEAPIASVLAALPEHDGPARHRPTTKFGEYDAIVAAAAADAAAPRQERSLAGRRVEPPAPVPPNPEAPPPPIELPEQRAVLFPELVGRGPPTETAPPCDQAQTEQCRALDEAQNAFDQTRIATQSCPYKFTTVLLKTSTHLVGKSWTDFNAYVTSHGVRWSVRRRATGCSGGGHAVYSVDLSFDPHAVPEATGRLEAAPEALRVAKGRGRVAASAGAPSLLSGFPFQGSGGRAAPASRRRTPKPSGPHNKLDRSAVVAPDPERDPTATTSKYWGVNWDTGQRRWKAGYNDANGKSRTLGYFDTEEAAAHAVNAAIGALPPDVQRRRHTNPVVDGRLVPKPRAACAHNRKRRREEPAAPPPAAPPQKRVSAPPPERDEPDSAEGFRAAAGLALACLDAVEQD